MTTARRGRPRTAPYHALVKAGRVVLRIYPPGGQAQVRVPEGWTEEQTFRAWLIQWRGDHPDRALPEEWRPFETQAGAAAPGTLHLPSSYAARPVARRAPRPTPAAPPAPPPSPPWPAAVLEYIQARRDGWHAPGPGGHLSRLETLPVLENDLLSLGGHGRRRSRKPPFHVARPSDFTTAKLTELLRGLERAAFKAVTIWQWRQQLKTFCEWCEHRGYLPPGQVVFPRYPRCYTPRQAAATLGDLDRAIRLAPVCLPGSTAAFRPVLMLMRYTVLRRMDISRLARNAFHLDGARPYLEAQPYQQKKERNRIIPLGRQPGLVAELRAWLDAHPGASEDLVFGRRRPDGRVYSPGHMTSWNKALDRYGVPRNLDGTGGLHRARKASMSAVFDAAPASAGGCGYRVAQAVVGVKAPTLDHYYTRVDEVAKEQASLRPPGATTAPPVQLTFAFADGVPISGELRDATGVRLRWRLPAGGPAARRVLEAVDDGLAFTVIPGLGIPPLSGALGTAGATSRTWRKKSSASSRPRRPSRVAIPSTR